MFAYGNRGYVAIQNGSSNGRSVYQGLMQGRITVSGVDSEGKKFTRIVQVEDGQIMDNRHKVDGRLVHHIAYGRFETTLSDRGREITRFNPRTGKGRHGKSRRFSTLFGYKGCVHSWFKQGRLVRQKFIFDNGKVAYDWTCGRPSCVVRNYFGREMYRITGRIDGSQHWSGGSVFDREMSHWFAQSEPFKVEKFGQVIFAGQYENRQRVSRWVLDGVEHFYEHGVAIPKKLFETPPDKLNLKSVLRIPNAQLRMAMLEKARNDRSFAKRLAGIGTEVHRQGSMRLYDVKGLDTRILRVICPSTQSRYYINVPKDSRRCEEARQWTFHVGTGVTGNIQFAQET